MNIRWMVRRDLPEVLEIESQCFEFPWTEEDFIRALKQRNCIGMVLDGLDSVDGFMVYELHKGSIHLLNFAVHPDRQRRGLGREMFLKLAGKLSRHRRRFINLEIRETNLAGQLFFRDMGCLAVVVLRNFYDDTDEDAYVMQFRYMPEVDEANPTNRILPLFQEME